MLKFNNTTLSPLLSALGLRHRYVYTRDNKLRLRYTLTSGVLAIGLLSGFGMPALSSYSQSEMLSNSYIVSTIGEQIEGISEKATTRLARYKTAAPVSNSSDMNEAKTAAAAPKPVVKKLEPYAKAVKIGKGDTLAGVLQKAGVSGGDAYNIVTAVSDHYDPRKIKPGQVVNINFKPDQSKTEYEFDGLAMEINALQTVNLTKSNAGTYDAELAEKPTETVVRTGQTKIEVSLFGSGLKAGIPSAVIAETIRIYSWDVDFQRDIRQGDLVDIMYEDVVTKDGDSVKYGDILYARLNVNGQDIPVYRYTMKNGDTDYFTPNGQSIRKALMKTPIDGARISSGFGMRRHPVLGYNKMHKGMDFAAPTGTPIYAAGDGTIEKMGRHGGYGNYVRIRHNSQIKTAYAHLNKFKSGLSAGARVRQGQVIGYVGTTGRSTGPHLHYEVMENGRQINPRSVKLPQGEILKGEELKGFKSHMAKIDRQFRSISTREKLAFLEQ